MLGGDRTASTFVVDSVANLPRVGSRGTDELAAEIAASGRDVPHLHAHPPRELPQDVLEAVAAAARENRTVPSRGLPALRQAIADRLSAEFGRSIDPEHEVLVTAGAMQALDLVLRATAFLSPVMTPEPCFFMQGLAPRLV